MSDVLTAITDGPTRHDVLLTTPAVWNTVENILTREERRPNTPMAQAGFKNMTYRSVPITYDKNMPKAGANDHSILYLNFDYWKLYKHDQFNMRRHPWMPNNAGQFEVIINVGNTCSNNLRYWATLDKIEAEPTDGYATS